MSTNWLVQTDQASDFFEAVHFFAKMTKSLRIRFIVEETKFNANPPPHLKPNESQHLTLSSLS